MKLRIGGGREKVGCLAQFSLGPPWKPRQESENYWVFMNKTAKQQKHIKTSSTNTEEAGGDT